MNNTRFVMSVLSKITISVLEIGLFAVVLFRYYGPAVFSDADSVGYWITMALFIIMYTSLGNVFRAFKIYDYSASETLFSQFLSFGMADAMMYAVFSLVRHNFVNIVPGVVTVLAQLLAAICWALIAKRATIVFAHPETAIIVTGSAATAEFRKKLEKKKQHLFRIDRVLPVYELERDWREILRPYQAVIFYEVDGPERARMVSFCMQNRKSIYITPQLDDITMQGFAPRHLIDTPLMKYEYRSERFFYNLAKRLVDIAISFVGLVFMSPILLFTALAIYLEDHGPVFFLQKRCTKDGKVFQIIKFRSMIVNAEAGGKSIPCVDGDPRITRVGRIIRKTRIDEFPQILNVLKGDMSIVGPRPERVEHVEEYTREIPEFAYRLRVKGGLTGYAQIYGKYNTSPYDKLRLDLQYIEQQSLLLDFKLMLQTIKIMFVPESTEGFSKADSAAVTENSKTVEELEK